MWGNCDGNLSTPSTFYCLTTPRNQYKRREGPKVVSNIFSPSAELENETFRLFALGGFGPGLDSVDAADEPEFGGEPESGQSDEHDAPPFTPRRRRRQIGGQQKPTHNDDDAGGRNGGHPIHPAPSSAGGWGTRLQVLLSLLKHAQTR